ncbi:MAG: hypothetical protein U0790_14265 [Isosphaeraceae bacterium]
MNADETGSTPSIPVQSSMDGGMKAGVAAGLRGAKLVSVIMGFATAAGLVAWLVGEATLDLVGPSASASADPYAFNALNAQLARASGFNGAIAFGALGGLLGLSLGIAGALSRGSLDRSTVPGLTGLVLGAVAGVLPALVLMPLQWHSRNDDAAMTGLVLPTLFHLGLWAGIGLTAGLAFGIGRFGWDRGPLLEAAISGLVAACLGTVIYEVAGALLFPFAYTSHPISTTAGTRLFARLVLTTFIAIGLIRATAGRAGKPAAGPIGELPA